MFKEKINKLEEMLPLSIIISRIGIATMAKIVKMFCPEMEAVTSFSMPNKKFEKIIKICFREF